MRQVNAADPYFFSLVLKWIVMGRILVWSEAHTWTFLGDYYSVTGAGDGEGWQPHGGGSDHSHTRAPRLARIQVWKQYLTCWYLPAPS